MTEYEFDGSFEVGFNGECLGHLKLAELKKKLLKTTEDFFEKSENVCSYDVSDGELFTEYEKLDV